MAIKEYPVTAYEVIHTVYHIFSSLWRVSNITLLYRWKGEQTVKLEGSDHAPVYASLLEIPDTPQHSTPSLSARYNPKIHGLQQTLGKEIFPHFCLVAPFRINNILMLMMGVGIVFTLDCTFCSDASYLHLECVLIIFLSSDKCGSYM